MSEENHELSRDEKVLLEKARHYCAYQERCVAETRRKMKLLGADEVQTGQLIDILKQEGFLNEKRFAMTFVHGKFSNNQWGRIKIRQELRNRNIDESVIDEAMKQIDEPSYEKKIMDLASSKAASLKARDTSHLPEKIAAYCLQKGYEPTVFWPVINKLLT